MKKSENDYGLKEINLDDYKLKKNNFPIFPLLVLFLLFGIIYYYKDIFINNNIQTDLKKENNNFNKIKEEERSSNAKSLSADSITLIPTKEDLVNFNSVTEINHITGNYYIISGSFSNYNLSLNKANFLNDNGFNAFIISPVNQNKMFRVAVDVYDDIDTAKENLKSYKEKLNNELWILKY